MGAAAKVGQVISAQARPEVRMFLVYTPEYGTTIPILDDGTGPIEYGADFVVIRARTRARAKVLAVRYWRRHWKWDGWVVTQDSDGLCPFTGLKVEEYVHEPEEV